MKLIFAVLVLVLLVETQAHLFRSPLETVEGARNMFRAYRDMRQGNWKDRLFNARGNHDAANRGPVGRWINKVVSNAREAVQRLTRRGNPDAVADQATSLWRRNGGDSNRFRLKDLLNKY